MEKVIRITVEDKETGLSLYRDYKVKISETDTGEKYTESMDIDIEEMVDIVTSEVKL